MKMNSGNSRRLNLVKLKTIDIPTGRTVKIKKRIIKGATIK